MSISSISSQNKGSKFLNLVIYLLSILGIVFIFYFGGVVIKNIGNIKGVTSLTTRSNNMEAEVLIDEKTIGTTPLESTEIPSGERQITVKTADRTYTTSLDFLKNSQALVERDLGVSDIFSSGKNVWLEKSSTGSVITVTSDPSNAKVLLDSSEIGATPFSSGSITEGDYTLLVEAPGYEAQAEKIKITKDVNLNINIKLFPLPVPSKVELLEGSTNLYNLITNNPAVISDPKSWAKAVSYWNSSRGINLAGLGVNKDLIFDFYIDFNGDVYDKNGNKIEDQESLKQLTEAEKGAYLGRESDGQGLSKQAKDSLTALEAAGLASSKKATIKTTGTGWLRVRSEPGLNGAEVAKVDVGNSYSVLEEQGEWVKIKVSPETEGWVSKTYIDISE